MTPKAYLYDALKSFEDYLKTKNCRVILFEQKILSPGSITYIEGKIITPYDLEEMFLYIEGDADYISIKSNSIFKEFNSMDNLIEELEKDFKILEKYND